MYEEKSCNRTHFGKFSRFHVVFVIKGKFISNLGCFGKKRKRNWRCRIPEWATAHFRVSIVIENSGPMLRLWSLVATWFSG